MLAYRTWQVSKVVINQVDAAAALVFWRSQDDARIFLHPQVLTPLCAQVDWWLATWDDNPMCLWPVCHSKEGRLGLPELSQYVGPLWHDALARKKAHRQWSIKHSVQRAMMELLLERYKQIVFELPPGTRDVRVLQWFESDIGRPVNVTIECRHTAIITRPALLLDDSLESILLAGFSRNRRRDVRDSQANGYREWTNPEPAALYELYSALLGGKHDGDKAQRRQHDVMTLVGLAQGGFGRVIAYRDAMGLPASFALLLASKRTALPLLLASSPVARNEGLQAVLMLQSMLRSFEDGVHIFDFAGANSVIGAEEKHRYGACADMYFRVAVESK